MAESTVLQLLVQLKDEASAGLKSFSDNISSAQTASDNFAKSLAWVGAGVLTEGGFAVKVAGDAQASMTQLTTAFQSSQKAAQDNAGGTGALAGETDKLNAQAEKLKAQIDDLNGKLAPHAAVVVQAKNANKDFSSQIAQTNLEIQNAKDKLAILNESHITVVTSAKKHTETASQLAAAQQKAADSAIRHKDEINALNLSIETHTKKLETLKPGQDKVIAAHQLSGEAADKDRAQITLLTQQYDALQEKLQRQKDLQGESGMSMADFTAKIKTATDTASNLGFSFTDSVNSIKTFQAQGLTVNESTKDMAIAMDLARFKNEDLGTASQQLAMVMEGGGKAAKQLGVNMKDTASPTEAMGLIAQKVAGQAQAGTADFNVQMAILKSKFDDFQIAVGSKLLPVLTSLLQNAIIPLANKAIDLASNVQNLTKWFEEHKVILIAVAGAIAGMLLPALWAWASAAAVAAFNMVLALAPFALIGAAIALLVAGIVWLVQNWQMVSAKAKEIWGAVAGFFAGIWNDMTGAITSVWNGIKDFFNTVWNGIKDIFTFVAELAVGAVIAIFAMFGINIVDVFGKMKLYFDMVWAAIKSIFITTLGIIKNTWTTIWNAISGFLGPIWETMKSVISNAWNFIVDQFNSFTKPLTDAWTNMWNGIGNTLKTVWEGIKQTIKDSINWIIEKINGIIEAFNKVAAAGAGALHLPALQIPTIPLLANGGIVSSPTLAMIGEAGPEAVVPLNKMSSFGSGTHITVNITGNSINNSVDIRKMADAVSGAIVDKLKLNTKLAI